MADLKYYVNCQYRLRTNAAPRTDIIASIDEVTSQVSIYGANKLRSNSHVSRSVDKTLMLGEQVSQSTFNDYLYAIEKEDVAAGYYIDCTYNNTYKKNSPTETCAIYLDNKGNLTVYGADSLVINTTLYRSFDKTVSFGKKTTHSKFKMFLIAILATEQIQSEIADAHHKIIQLENAINTHCHKNELYSNLEVIELAERCEESLFTHDFAVELLSRANTVRGLKSVLRCIAIVVPYFIEIELPIEQSKTLAKNYDISCTSLVTVELAKIAFSIALNGTNSRHSKPILPLISKKAYFEKDQLCIIDKEFEKNLFVIPSTNNTTMANLISFFLVIIDRHLDDLIEFNRTKIHLEDFEILNKLKEDELHLRSYNVLQRLNILAKKEDSPSIYMASVLDNITDNIADYIQSLHFAYVNNDKWNTKPLSDDINTIEDFCNAYDFSPRPDLLSNKK